MFVNCSNHPSEKWSDKQRKEAEKYGEIQDVAFPEVGCHLKDEEVEQLANQTFEKIMEYQPDAVMCMGEFVVCYRIVQKLKAEGMKVLASCSERKVIEHVEPNGVVRKEAVFSFQGFREY